MRQRTPDMMLDEVQEMDTVAAVMGTPSVRLALQVLRVDGGTQPRAEIDQSVVANYAEAVGNGAILPPPVAFYDGKDYWIGDGFHRHAAYSQLGLAEILVDVRSGTQRDAVLYSVGANATHGLPRTDSDKRRAVQRLLDDAEWSAWSDREIARRCNVSGPFVAKLREAICKPFADSAPVQPRKVERNGVAYTMNTAKIGPVPFKSEWAPLTWAVYDWATTKAGQAIQSLKDLGYFKDKDLRWPRLIAFLKAQGFLDTDKGAVLTACGTVLKALREDTVPQRISDTASACPDTESEPVLEAPEVVPDLIVSVESETIPAGGWVGKSKPIVPKPSTNGAKPVVRAVIHPTHMEVNPGPDSKLVVFHTAAGDVFPVSLLPEQASWLAGELLS